MTLVLPTSNAVTSLEQAEQLCSSIEAWSEQCDSVSELKDATNRLAAIDEYLARTSTDGRARVAAAMRRLEVRIGALLGSAQRGGDRKSSSYQPNHSQVDLNDRQANDFRKMAANPDIVEKVIAESTDQNPPSRRQVIREISAPRRNPLIDDFRRSILSLDRAVNGLSRLVDDNRFPANRNAVAGELLGDVERHRDTLARLARVIGEK